MYTLLYIIIALIAGAALGYIFGERHATRETRLRDEEQTEKLLQENRNAHAEALKAMENRFQTLAQETLESRSRELQLQNKESMNALQQQNKENLNTLQLQNQENLRNLVQPVRDDLQKMQNSVNLARENAAAQKASMDKTIEGLLKHTQAVEQNAQALAQALQSNGKMQGDWGEQLLASILEESGLRENHEYTTQENVKDEEGRNLRPDVIVKCPGNRSIVIDSKVSLSAFIQYSAAQTPQETERAERENLLSVRRHIDELSTKHYEKLVSGALPQVLMFIPNEGSYILALRTDPTIGQYAYRKGVILINPTNLMLALQMVYNLWQTERQNKNTEKITRQAADLYDKFVVFAEKFQRIRESQAKLTQTTEDAFKALGEGKGNIVRRLEGLRELGITPSKKIPTEIEESAE